MKQKKVRVSFDPNIVTHDVVEHPFEQFEQDEDEVFANQCIFEHEECDEQTKEQTLDSDIVMNIQTFVQKGFEQTVRPVVRVQTSLLDPQLMVSLSVCEVKHDPMDHKGPTENGLYDLRMGPFSREFHCTTCGGDQLECPGHFGHITLPLPVIHPLFKRRIVQVLRCVCYRCRRLLIDPTDPNYASCFSLQHGPTRFDQIHDRIVKRVRTCLIRPDATGKHLIGCGFEQPFYLLSQSMRIRIHFADGTATESVVDEIRAMYDVLRHIPDEDVASMGFHPQLSRPEWMLISVLPVPPIAVRPPVHRRGMLDHDDLTHKLQDIVSACTTLRNDLDGTSRNPNPDSSWRFLQFQIARYIDNAREGVGQDRKRNTGQMFVTLRQRFKGKTGRLRHNLMGKRVQFSGRSVITIDTSLAVDQVGIPLVVAMGLTVPVLATHANILELTKLVERGPEQYPGANYIQNPEKQLFYINKTTLSRHTLSPGWTVHRHLIENDIVVFNRQPSLHRPSIMAHRVVILKVGKTFRLHSAVCQPYNADCDGDEMNIHVPQNCLSEAELVTLVALDQHFLSPKSNGPCMGLVQDGITGLFLLTRPDVFLDRAAAMQIHMTLDSSEPFPEPAVLKPVARWTGKQMFNLILCKHLYFERLLDFTQDRTPSPDHPEDAYCVISNSELLRGRVDKSMVGSASNSLLHHIVFYRGGAAAVEFLTAAQKLADVFLLHNGFSIGLRDIMVPESTHREADAVIDAAKTIATHWTLRQWPERMIANCLNQGRSVASSRTLAALRRDNAFTTMITSGAKGASLNMHQIATCVGQQEFAGGRVENLFRNRTLPHFEPHDNSPIAKGFCENSYITGLTPVEFFFHMMAGRIGLISTAVSTKDTGYMNHRIGKLLEEIVIAGDGSVRDSRGRLYSLQYGADGFDATRLIRTPILHVEKTEAQFRHFFKTKQVSDQDLDAVLVPLWKTVLSWHCKAFQTLPTYTEGFVRLPFQPLALLHDRWDGKSSNITTMQQLEQTLKQANCPPLLTYCCLTTWTPTALTEHKTTWGALCCIAVRKLWTARVAAGESVGILAAQSIGEPAQQMTLNVFHFTGVGEKNVTLGVPRMAEIMGVSKTIKNPAMMIFLKPQFVALPHAVEWMRQILTTTTVEHVSTAVKIVPFQYPLSTHDPDYVWLHDAVLFQPIPDIAQYKWSVRIVLNRVVLRERGFLIRDFVKRLQNVIGTSFPIIGATEAEQDSVLAVRVLLGPAVLQNAAATPLPDSIQNALTLYFPESTPQLQPFATAIAKSKLSMNTRIQRVASTTADVAHFQQPISQTKVCKQNVPVLETEGTALSTILGQPGVDVRWTISNHVVEVYHVLGVEAARAVIIREMQLIVAAYGVQIDPRHFRILADRITQSGFLVPMTRNGLDRIAESSWMRATYEKNTENLAAGAEWGSIDPMMGPSEKIIMGHEIKHGTGTVDLMMDIPFTVKHAVPQPSSLNKIDEQQTDSPLNDDQEEEEDGFIQVFNNPTTSTTQDSIPSPIWMFQDDLVLPPMPHIPSPLWCFS